MLPDYWMRRDALYPRDMTPNIEHNAEIMVGLSNQLLTRFGQGRKVTSGWRPPSVNQNTPGASRTSKHMTAQAIDLADPDGDLDDWCMSSVGQRILIELGLWLEHPFNTPKWCHVQSIPPPSGNRVFYR